MIGFFIKKAFFDGWDNLLQILLMNVIILAIGFGGFFLAALAAAIVPLSVFILVCAALLEGVVVLGVSVMMARIADYKSGSFRELLSAMQETWKHGALFALVVVVAVFVFSVTVPYYLGLGSVIGFALAILMFWVAVIVILSFQWLLPIRSQLDKNFLKCIKKSFIIFFDNPGFSIFMFFYSFVLLALSLLLVFLMPGVSGLILAQNEALRLRLYKYDWLEKHPELDIKTARKAIPWEEILAEDEETVGYRSFKSFIFPWKD
jgi:hypothetical protein